ncbi:hypothetical protein DFH06DRAFT_1231586 [Mycena polygramma]|nr:hypothetical protein DFH06DRAFT_1231586 [Mycena polygramma]
MHLFPLLLLLDFALFASAGVYFIQPASGSTCSAGTPCTVSWLDDGDSPLLDAVGVVTVGLYTGTQQMVQTIPPLDVASLHSVEFTPDAQAGPNSDSYCIAFTSTNAKENGTDYIAFSPFFTLKGMSGSFSSPLASATASRSIPSSLTRTGSIIPTTITVGSVNTSLPPLPTPSTSTSKPATSSSAHSISSSRFTTSSVPSSQPSSPVASASPSVTKSSAATTGAPSSAAASHLPSLPLLAVVSLCALVFTSLS